MKYSSRFEANEMYVRVGYQKPIAYETICEIQVQDGDIISVSDLSKKMKDLCSQGRDRGTPPSMDSSEDIEKWVGDTFSLDYDIE